MRMNSVRFKILPDGKMLDAAPRGGRLIAVVFFSRLYQEVIYA